MKGLLLKDFYMIVRYCRAFLFIMAVFIIFSVFGNDNVFFVMYPVVFAGMIPITLISFDEKEKWDIYSAALPYSREQLVTCKYTVGLISELTVILLSAAVQFFRMSGSGEIDALNFGYGISVMFIMGFIGPAIILPVIFKFGTEKGRIVYFAFAGLVCAACVIFSDVTVPANIVVKREFMPFVMCALAVLLYVISWRISVIFYRRKEL